MQSIYHFKLLSIVNVGLCWMPCDKLVSPWPLHNKKNNPYKIDVKYFVHFSWIHKTLNTWLVCWAWSSVTWCSTSISCTSLYSMLACGILDPVGFAQWIHVCQTQSCLFLNSELLDQMDPTCMCCINRIFFSGEKSVQCPSQSNISTDRYVHFAPPPTRKSCVLSESHPDVFFRS